MSPGEHDDSEVGVDVRLLQGPGESEYLVDGLLPLKFGVGGGRLRVLRVVDNPDSSDGITG